MAPGSLSWKGQKFVLPTVLLPALPCLHFLNAFFFSFYRDDIPQSISSDQELTFEWKKYSNGFIPMEVIGLIHTSSLRRSWTNIAIEWPAESLLQCRWVKTLQDWGDILHNAECALNRYVVYVMYNIQSPFSHRLNAWIWEPKRRCGFYCRSP